MQRPSTRLCSRPYSSTDAGRARLTASAMESDFQYEKAAEPPASSSAKTMKYGPAADEQVERGAHRQHEADEGEDQEVGAALVLGDLVVHAGVRVLGGSETSVRRWGERAGGAGGGRRAAAAGGGAAEVDRRGRW